jgi:alkylation response protein AidB-like acyl-CoA dehydrogenase
MLGQRIQGNAMATGDSSASSVFLELSRLAESADRQPQWPAQSWQCLAALQGLKWTLPTPYGVGLEEAALWQRLESLAGACTTTALIWTQRESACRHIVEKASAAVRQELLGPLAEGTIFTTVGVAHLTTSRQHISPAMVATEDDTGFILDGVMPWVSAASQADYFVTGAVLTGSGLQILLIVPRDSAGVTVGEPMDLMALAGSMTTEVTCSSVRVERKWLLAGPAEKVLTLGRGGAGGLHTVCLALGLSRAAIDFLELEARQRPELEPITVGLGRRHSRLQKAIYSLTSNAASPPEVALLRAGANALVLQSTQAALTASKGTGFRHPHPAQRWARQALFFLVWSCPWPAASATLDALVNPSPDCESGL